MDDALRSVLDVLSAVPPARTVAERRAAYDVLCRFSGAPAMVDVRAFSVRARDGHEIPVRSYGEGPLLVYFHGGGYVCGSLDSHHAACSQIAAYGIRVVSVGYRLAPEHRFPTALWDGVDVVRALDESCFVGGDSAGGNLAAALSLVAADDLSLNVRGQILMYPTLDAYFRAPSWETVPLRQIANRDDSLEFDVLYARDESDFGDPLFSPVEARAFDGVAPAWIFLGECDPARGDGEAYAAQLRAGGVNATVRVFDGMPHGFVTMASRLEGARELHRAVAENVILLWTEINKDLTAPSP